MISSVVGPSSFKALLKAKLAWKNHLWLLFGGLLLVWCTTTFYIPAKSLHMRSMLSKLMRGTENCDACSWHWSIERPTSSPWQRWTTHCTANVSEVKWIGLQSFASSSVFTWPLANWLPFFQASWQLLAGKMLPQPTSRRQKILSKSLPNPEVRNFTLQE